MNADSEYHTAELPAIQTLQRLGYAFLDGKQLATERADPSDVILSGRLRTAIARLNPTLDDANRQRAFDRLTTVVGTSLLDVNEQIWKLLRGGSDGLSLKQTFPDSREEYVDVAFLDYANPANNDWLVVRQPRFAGAGQESVPDLVLFVNGLPLVVIECKAAGAPNAAEQALHDLAYYQRNSERLFHYNQLCAGLWGVGGRYAAIGAPASAYVAYNDLPQDAAVTAALGAPPTPQDRLLYHLCAPARLLDVVRHFVLFEREAGGAVVKKLPRYQQVRATNRIIQKLQAHGQGGVVWHTQGSGKSLTMAYLIRKLRAPESGFQNPTILVLTDRQDLDRQITQTLRAVGLPNVQQALSVNHLAGLLRNDYGAIITSTLQKFEQPDPNAEDTPEAEPDEPDTTRVDRQVMDGLLLQIKKALREGKWVEVERTEVPIEKLSAKPNLFVLVDEAHRSHYGFLAAFMRTALPHAKFIAFTGTPIATADRSTLAEFYGDEYLDVYTIKESVADGATVELLYDAGVARLDVKKEALDAAFAQEFGHESAEKQDLLKQEALRRYQLSRERIREICEHLLTHYQTKIRPEGHKALLVCAGRPAALLYKEVLDELADLGWHDLRTRVVVSMGAPKSDPLAADHYERLNWNRAHPEQTKPVLLTSPEDVKAVTDDFKLPFAPAGVAEDERTKGGQKKYDNTAILIVSDMLLTGYDAPLAACLYLDKPLRAHNLLQALARVNRTGLGKVAGYVLDYVGITEALLEALDIYSGDVAQTDLLRDRNEEIPRLALHHTQLVDFLARASRHSRTYARDRYIEAAVAYLEALDRRDQFKALLKAFNRSLNIVLPHPAAIQYQTDFVLFTEIRLRARNTYPEDEELKISPDESQRLQALIDAHLTASGVQNLLEEPVSIIDREKFRAQLADATPATRALKMRHHLVYQIKVGMARNPAFFQPLAERLEALLREHEADRLAQAQLLLEFDKLQDALADETRAARGEGFITQRQADVFNALQAHLNGAAADLTRAVFASVAGELDIVGWEAKGEVRQEIENKLTRLFRERLAGHEPPVEARPLAKELLNLLRQHPNA